MARLLHCAGALGLLYSAGVHFFLWTGSYRFIPTIGVLFLIQSVTATVLAVVVAVFQQPWAAVCAATFTLATAAALTASVNISLFGFRDSFSSPYALSSLVVELATTVVLIGALAFR